MKSAPMGRPSRLTNAQIAAIRADRRKYKHIALDYNISVSYVAQIKSNQRAEHRK